MAKFAELVPTAGRYVNAADKAMLAGDAPDMAGPVALRLTRAVYQPRAMYGPRWLIEVRTLATREDIAIDFAAADKAGEPIEARQTMFAELRDRLDAGEAFDPVVLAQITPSGKRGGNPFWTFLDAPAELVANPVAPRWADEDDDDDEQPEDEPEQPKRRPRLAKAAK